MVRHQDKGGDLYVRGHKWKVENKRRVYLHYHYPHYPHLNQGGIHPEGGSRLHSYRDSLPCVTCHELLHQAYPTVSKTFIIFLLTSI